MQLTRLMVPQSKWNIKCPYSMDADGICVHNTANKASAMAEISYMVGNNNSVSYHYAIDDYRIVQGIEENRNTWHAGDGEYGKGNRNKISIEICYSTGDIEQFKKAEILTAKFIAYKLKEKGWGIDKVSKHEDYANKYCPHKTLDLGWERFLNLIRGELGQTVEQPSNEAQPKENATGKIADIQDTLNKRYGFNIAVDNVYGPETHTALVKALQTELNIQFNVGLVVDGIFGPKTKSACVVVEKGDMGNITWLIQAMLIIKGYNLETDSIFGQITEHFVREFQKSVGIDIDGLVGRETFAKMFA